MQWNVALRSTYVHVQSRVEKFHETLFVIMVVSTHLAISLGSGVEITHTCKYVWEL